MGCGSCGGKVRYHPSSPRGAQARPSIQKHKAVRGVIRNLPPTPPVPETPLPPTPTNGGESEK